VHEIPQALSGSPGFLLGKAAQRGAELVEQALHSLQLKARHYGVLVALQDIGPLSQQELGRLLRIDRTTMVALIDDLETLGLVQRDVDSEDRRAYQIQLTARGKAALKRACSAVSAADDQLVAPLTIRERDQLVLNLRRLCGIH
jgi:DNA-binding MarR family transcriptional regulator